MTEPLSIQVDSETKKRLDKSFLAAEAIESEGWQLGEIQIGIQELDAGQAVSHDKVAGWLKSWGNAGENKTLR